MTDDTEIMAETDWAAFYENNPSSVPPYAFCFRGFPDEAVRSRITETAGLLVDFFSRIQPLQDLDGITYAADYAEALATLDRGFEARRTLTATDDAVGQGIAMAPPVRRDGQIKTHVVIAAKLGLDLLSEDPAEKELAVHTLMHELGHVVEHTLMERSLPGVMLNPISDRYEFALFSNAHAAWSEYFAERTSAEWGPSFHSHFQELLEGSIRQQVAEIGEARAAFRWWDQATHRPVAEGTFNHLGRTMKSAGYLFGHADGRDVDPFLGREELRELIEAHGLTSWLLDVREKLRTLFDTRDDWKSLEEHFSLSRTLEQGCGLYGVTIGRHPDFDFGWRVT